jgi:hypothetical protein
MAVAKQLFRPLRFMRPPLKWRSEASTPTATSRKRLPVSLIDELLPSYQFHEKHSCSVAAASAVVISSVSTYRPDADPFFKFAIALRELPMRFLKKGALPAPFGLQSFTLLDRNESEIVYGLTGQFWKMDYGLSSIADREAFVSSNNENIAKLVLGFSAVSRSDRASLLTTETRVFCPNRSTQLKFTPYWLLIRPVSGLIRHRILSSIRKDSERVNRSLQAPLPSSNL